MSEVDELLAGLDHPLTETMQRVREVILGADPRMIESVKWKSPTFEYRGNLASINPRAKQFVSLMFHRGAEIPGEHPALQGGEALARYMRFTDVADVERQRADLEAVVRAWVELKGK